MRNYLAEYDGNVEAAILAMAADLMRGDPELLGPPMPIANALLAAAQYHQNVEPNALAEIMGAVTYATWRHETSIERMGI